MLCFESLFGALKKHMEGNDIHHSAQTQVLHLNVCFVMLPAAHFLYTAGKGMTHLQSRPCNKSLNVMNAATCPSLGQF